MTITIDIQNDSNYLIDAARLQAASQQVLNQHDVDPDTTLSVVFVDNAYIQSMNLKFRGFDSPTDVLSFPADEPPVEIDGEPPYLGDLIVAYPYASEQAAREGHTLNDSLALLVIHGTLHLLGYEHDTPENRAEMWAAQDAALTALGISTAIVPALEGGDHDQSH